MTADFFKDGFRTLTSHAPMRWQMRLHEQHFATGDLPSAVSVPTGLGKTAVMAIWLVALTEQMKNGGKPRLPRHLVYVVDRRAVVDQATRFAEDLRKNLSKTEGRALADALGLGNGSLPISTLRGQFVDNREWLEDPAKPAIIVGTVDMIGSRLLFEGYGVSRKMRPYHAGLLGADTLVLLDEAHLVPTFEALLAEIAGNAERQYGPKKDDLAKLVPKFQLLPLSATGRRQTAQPFRLEERDFRNPDETVTVERLFARKQLVLQETGDKDLAKTLADSAWALSDSGKKPVRVIVYCDSRDTAEKTKTELDKWVKDTAAKGRTELFVGARRVKERIDAEQRLQALGFLAGNNEERSQPSFLVATSAGEVGVDLDADHMACDLVAWERMVQRFGRVNRRGGKDKDGKDRQAEIIVLVEAEPEPKKAAKDALEKKNKGKGLSDKEQKAIEAHEKLLTEFRNLQGRFKSPFGEALKKKDGEDFFEVSPETLRQLSERARSDENLSKVIADASSPAPLRPALNRALVDAWAMTSLPEHTGRPEIKPWLHGWVPDEPQTVIVWRKHLPVRNNPQPSKQEIEEFFEAAPIHVSETLETESYRVMGWLQKRAEALGEEWKPDVVGMLLGGDGKLAQVFRRHDIPASKVASDNDKKRFQALLFGKTLVLDARFGGLKDGLLNDDTGEVPVAADDGQSWITTEDNKPIIRFRIRERSSEMDEDAEKEWRESLRFVLERSADGEVTRWLSIEKWRDTSNNEDDRAEGRPQSLAEHQSWTAERATAIGKRLELPDEYVCMLGIAARLHDEGKKGRNWKRAFNVERYAKELGIPGQPLAKTPRFNWTLLDGYRHEFGSLPWAEKDAEFKKLQEKNPDLADLVLHLIAAHHGFARPLIETRGCDDAPPSALDERAREVALRFARLQKRWGAWGLAWWESLLRAADAQASRANDEREDG